MAIFKSHTVVQSFVMICITINAVHADKEGISRECMRQLKFAFRNEKSATQCLKIAIEYYTKDNYIPVSLFAPPIVVHSFEELISSDQTGPPTSPSQTSNFREPISDEMRYMPGRRNPINYAMLYYDELETMIHGTGVPKPKVFCIRYFGRSYEPCMGSLKIFGTTPKSAVLKAFTSYTLKECEDDIYRHRYMEIIIEGCIVTRTL